MESTKAGSGRGALASWLALLLASLKVAIVAFFVLQAKEWVDARSFDFAGVLVDALLIALGVFIVDAILRLSRTGRSSGG